MKKIKTHISLLLYLLFYINCISSQNIFTYAGTGINGYTGDGGPSKLAQIGGVSGIDTDIKGNIYFCDNSNGCIRKIDTLGYITTIANSLAQPWGIDIDTSGNIYFTELYYNRVRKINTLGVISTVAGLASTSGGFSGDGGSATSALLKNPYDVAVDNTGNIYIAQGGFSVIRMVNTSGIISTIAGFTGGFSGDGGLATAAQLNFPRSIDVDTNGNIYIADCNNHRIRKIDASGIITTIAGTGTQGALGDGGQASQAEISEPTGIKIDNFGNLFIVEWGLRIRKMDTQGIITKVAGTTSGYSGDGGSAVFAQILATDVTVNKLGNVYIADGLNYRIREVCNGSCVAGFNELSKEQKIIVYPNPAANTLQISDENNEFENSTLQISDYLGQTVLKLTYSNTIDVSKLSTGIYTLKIITLNKGSYYSKFVKE